MITAQDPVAKFAAMSDEKLFSIDVIWEADADAFRAEKAKRLKRIAEEKARINQERMERLQKRKEAVEYSDPLATEPAFTG